MLAASLDEFLLVPHEIEERTGFRTPPDLREGLLEDVADGVVAPELVRIDRAVPGNAANALAGRVAAVESEQFQRLVGVGMSLGLHLEVEGETVAVVVHRQDLHGEARVEARPRLGDDGVERGALLGVVEVRCDDLLAAAGVDEVVEADARHALGAHEVEDGGNCGDVVARHGDAQTDLDVAVAQAADGREGFLVGAGMAAEGVVDLLGAVDGDANIGDAEIADPVCPAVVDQGAVCREGDADSP